MLALDLQPASIVEDHGFQTFLKVIDPKFIPPSWQTITRDLLPKLYKDKLLGELHKTEWCAVTTDLWTSQATEGYLTMTCYYLTNEWNLRSVVLVTVHAPVAHTAANISSVLSHITERWNIKDKITCVVTDNASNVTKAARLNEWNQHTP